MKIAIVTVYDSIVNYGSFLQAYALGEVINAMGHEVYFVRRMNDDDILSRFDEIIKRQNAVGGEMSLQNLLKNIKKKLVIHREIRANRIRIDCFKRDWSNFRIIDADQLEAEGINLIICGSDEIWNIHNADIDLEFYGCGWNNKIPKIAYAISSGNTLMDEVVENHTFIEAVRQFNRLLPRDEMTKNLVEAITAAGEDIVCDPTILLGRNGFNIGENKIRKPYMLVYSYYLTKEEKSNLRRYAKEHGLRIISACINLSIADEVVYVSSLEFPSLISHAECVYTTTFHGTIFSLMFAKRFCVMPRLPKVENLIEQAGAIKNACTNNVAYNEFERIMDYIPDYSMIYDALEKMKEGSFDKLKKVLAGAELEKIKTNITIQSDDTNYYYGFCPIFRKKSSSGGMFGRLATEIIKNGGVVFGACLNEKTKRVEHCSTDEVGLDKLLKSKYVESYMGDTFPKIQNELEKGRDVLFCGTPCQAAALSSLRESALRKYAEHLYIVDFLCEGVPSRSVFQQYLEAEEAHYKKKIAVVDFRSKYYGWNTYCMKMIFEDGTWKVRPSFADSYMHTFIMDLIMNRPSCYQCAFRETKKSDITIGDFWKVEQVDEHYFDNEGVSAVFTHTSKGEKLIAGMLEDGQLYRLDKKYASLMRQNLKTKQFRMGRDLFYADFVKEGYQSAIRKNSTYMLNLNFVQQLKLLKRWRKLEKRRVKKGN